MSENHERIAMKKIVTAFAALGMIAGPAHAADGEPVVFKPTGGWTADFGEDYCRLVRTFSDGTDQVSLAIERVQPGSMANLLLVGNGIKLYRRADTIGYNYLPAGDSRTTQLLRSDSADGQQMLIVSAVNVGQALPGFGGPGGGRGGAATPPAAAADSPPPAPGTPFYKPAEEVAFAEGIKGLALTDGTVTPVQIETGSLKNPITVLQDCTYDLVSYWGLDGAKHRTLSRTVVPQGGTTLPQGTVGFQDFAKLGGGANQVRLMIDAAGKPAECKIQAQTLGETTNRKICNYLMENAKFLPALDSEGQAIASYWMNSPLFMFGPPPGGG
jgi:hypothetical protein